MFRPRKNEWRARRFPWKLRFVSGAPPGKGQFDCTLFVTRGFAHCVGGPYFAAFAGGCSSWAHLGRSVPALLPRRARVQAGLGAMPRCSGPSRDCWAGQRGRLVGRIRPARLPGARLGVPGWAGARSTSCSWRSSPSYCAPQACPFPCSAPRTRAHSSSRDERWCSATCPTSPSGTTSRSAPPC